MPQRRSQMNTDRRALNFVLTPCMYLFATLITRTSLVHKHYITIISPIAFFRPQMHGKSMKQPFPTLWLCFSQLNSRDEYPHSDVARGTCLCFNAFSYSEICRASDLRKSEWWSKGIVKCYTNLGGCSRGRNQIHASIKYGEHRSAFTWLRRCGVIVVIASISFIALNFN